MISSKIRTMRRQKEVTQRQLAAKLGVKQPTVSGWEKGEIRLSIDRLYQIAHALNVTPGELLPDELLPEEPTHAQ